MGIVHQPGWGVALQRLACKVQAGALRARCSQCVFSGMAHRLMHFAAVAKAHFDLGRVHIHIDARRVHLHIQHIHRLAMTVQHIFVSAAGCVRQHFVAHKAAVDIGELLVRARASGVRNTGAAPDAHRRLTVVATSAALVAHSHRLRHEVFAQHIGQALIERRQRVVALHRGCSGPPLLDQLAFMPDGKSNVRPHQGMAAYRFQAVGQLGGVSF